MNNVSVFLTFVTNLSFADRIFRAPISSKQVQFYTFSHVCPKMIKKIMKF